MIDRDEAEQLLEAGGHLYLGAAADADDADGGVERDAGPVLRIYLDDYTGWPSFATVEAARAGQQTLVALHEAELRPGGDGLQVPYDARRLADAPTVADGEDPSVAEEDALFDYYGVPIDGVVPVVEHLGAVLVTQDDPRPETPGDLQVVEHDVDHPIHDQS